MIELCVIMHLKHLFTVDLNRFSVFGGEKKYLTIYFATVKITSCPLLYIVWKGSSFTSAAALWIMKISRILILNGFALGLTNLSKVGGKKIKLSMFYIFHSSVNTAQPEMNCICKSELSVKPETPVFAAFCNDGPILCSKKYTTLSSSFHH